MGFDSGAAFWVSGASSHHGGRKRTIARTRHGAERSDSPIDTPELCALDPQRSGRETDPLDERRTLSRAIDALCPSTLRITLAPSESLSLPLRPIRCLRGIPPLSARSVWTVSEGTPIFHRHGLAPAPRTVCSSMWIGR